MHVVVWCFGKHVLGAAHYKNAEDYLLLSQLSISFTGIYRSNPCGFSDAQIYLCGTGKASGSMTRFHTPQHP